MLARAKRQMEELEVDWADAFAMPETEPVTAPRQKKKLTEEPPANSHLPPAISASHSAKPPHPPGKVLAQKTADQQLMAAAAQRVQRQAEQNKKKEDEAKKKKKEEEEKRKKKEKEEEEKRKKKEKEEEEKRRKKAEEEKAEKVMLQRALSVSLLVRFHNTAPKAKQQSKADMDKLARDELMLRRDWYYKDGYKPRWIIYCTTAMAPMIVEGAEVKPAGARRAP